jgi:hypothetical protein
MFKDQDKNKNKQEGEAGGKNKGLLPWHPTSSHLVVLNPLWRKINDELTTALVVF